MTKKQIIALAPVFRRAAVRLANEEFWHCCHAIGDRSPDAKAYFEAVLRPLSREEAGEHPDSDMWDWNSWYGVLGYYTPANHNARIIGLLLCYNLAKEGYRP